MYVITIKTNFKEPNVDACELIVRNTFMHGQKNHSKCDWKRKLENGPQL